MGNSYTLDLNQVQKDILTKLTVNKPLRYSEIKPEQIENDLFNYHLQYLVKQELVVKLENEYSLSEKGTKLIANIDASGRVEDLFRVSVIAFVIENGKYLLQTRKRHPYYGDTASISGKVKKGEKIVSAAKRKLLEETGLICDFKFIGVLRKIRMNKDNEILEDILFHCCIGEKTEDELINETIYGKNYWGTIDEAIELEKVNQNGSDMSIQVLNRIKEKDYSMFYFEDYKTIEKYEP